MNKKITREQFGQHAPAYLISKTHAEGGSLQRIVELVDPQKSWEVLDIATGAGHTALAFSPFVKNVRATDITPQMLDQARQLKIDRGGDNIVIEYADAENLPYENESFDLITCRIAAHHFGDIDAFLQESFRVLRPNSLLIVVDNIVPGETIGDYVNALEKLRDPSHLRCLSREEWVSIFNNSGFFIEHQETLEKRLEFSFWAKRHNPVMQSYLQAMFAESSAETAAFLQPKFSENGLSFRLMEGIIIGRKMSPSEINMGN